MKAAEGRVAQAKNLGDQRALLGSLENGDVWSEFQRRVSLKPQKVIKIDAKMENGWTSPKVIFYIVLLRNIP